MGVRKKTSPGEEGVDGGSRLAEEETSRMLSRNVDLDAFAELDAKLDPVFNDELEDHFDLGQWSPSFKV